MKAFDVVMTLVTVLAWTVGVAGLSYTLASNHWQKEAAQHHAAHYYLDVNNNKQWTWNEWPPQPNE